MSVVQKTVTSCFTVIFTALVVTALVSCTLSVNFVDDKSVAKDTQPVKNTCDIKEFHLKADMPELPKIPKYVTKDDEVGEYMLRHIEDLREYVKKKDKELEELKKSCN